MTTPPFPADAFCVLVVDDEELYAEAVCRELRRQEIACDAAYTARDALRLAGAPSASGRYGAVLLDHRLPDEDGLRVIPRLLARQPGAAVVMMTAHQTIPNAVHAIRLGAEDYIVKETSLNPLVDRVLEIRRRHQVRQAGSGWNEHRRSGLLGRSSGMVRVLQDLHKLVEAPDTTVLLSGETGVGKEVAARYLHGLTGAGAGQPLVAVDCVALPEALAESLLFGHEKGSFTGADRTRVGAFEEAGGGTLFLDEIGDMEQRLQGKLLRVLESRTFQRLGSHRERPLGARVVAATNRDLSALVEQGGFRMDLYQRLAVFPVHLPPLRERGQDVLLLAEHFRAFYADKLGKEIEPLDDEVSARLSGYAFPGNVRELKNIIERAAIITDSGRVELRHLPARLLSEPMAAPAADPGSIPLDFMPGSDTLETLERRMIQQALSRARDVKTEAARLLGISRFQLLRRMDKYGLRGTQNGR